MGIACSYAGRELNSVCTCVRVCEAGWMDGGRMDRGIDRGMDREEPDKSS